METDGIRLLNGNEIVNLFRGQEATLLETVRAAYEIKEDDFFPPPWTERTYQPSD